MSTKEQRQRMAATILGFEARRDKDGHLAVYDLPANDGGGRYEVAGINEKYDREAVDALMEMLKAGKYAEAEAYAVEYIAKNTDSAVKLTKIPSIEFFLRDCVFNRGARGAVRILQRALAVPDDGDVGPVTEKARLEAEKDPQTLLVKLRGARENYERAVVGYRANFWNGLINRWNNALEAARTFPDTPDVLTAPQATVPTVPPNKPTSWFGAIVDAILAAFRHRPFTVPAPAPESQTNDAPLKNTLVDVASDPARLKAAQAVAARKLKDFDGEVYPHDGCAITLSCLMQAAGMSIPDTFQALALGDLLKERGWQVVPVGQQRAGDVGSTCGTIAHHGTDHIYLVLRVVSADEMLIADNQAPTPHARFASGKGKSPTTFFLRAPT